MGCCGGGNHSQHNNDHMKSQESPLDVLKARLAKGEITAEEYEQTRRMLESDGAQHGHATGHGMKM